MCEKLGTRGRGVADGSGVGLGVEVVETPTVFIGVIVGGRSVAEGAGETRGVGDAGSCRSEQAVETASSSATVKTFRKLTAPQERDECAKTTD